MAIFGMGGIKALALELAIIWGLYGSKQVKLTPDEIKGIERVAARRDNIGAGRKQAASAYRQKQIAKLTGTRYEALAKDTAFTTAYTKKTWLR